MAATTSGHLLESLQLQPAASGSPPRRVRPRTRGRKLLVAHPFCLARAGDSESGPARERPGASGQARGPTREEIPARPGPVWVAARGASWSTHHETAAAQKTINFSKGNRKKIIEITTAQKEKKIIGERLRATFRAAPHRV